MVMPEDVRAIFQDARTLQSSAVDQLDQGNIRDAAEKAWGATPAGHSALVPVGTGELLPPAKAATEVDSLGRTPTYHKSKRNRNGLARNPP